MLGGVKRAYGALVIEETSSLISEHLFCVRLSTHETIIS